VWLIYRCERCEAAWNCEIAERRLPSEIGAALYEQFLRNDLATAWRYAFDERVTARGGRVEPCAEVRVIRAGEAAAPVRIRLSVPHPCGVRLDQLLARELGVPRSSLRGAIASGALAIETGGEVALRRAVRDGQVAVWRG
jgi:hypothetical protein